MKPIKAIQPFIDRVLGNLEYSKGKEVGVACIIYSIDLSGQASIYNWVANYQRVFLHCGNFSNQFGTT